MVLLAYYEDTDGMIKRVKLEKLLYGTIVTRISQKSAYGYEKKYNSLHERNKIGTIVIKMKYTRLSIFK